MLRNLFTRTSGPGTRKASLFKAAYGHSHRIVFFAANAGIDDREDLFASWDLGAEPQPQPPNVSTIDTDLAAVIYGLKLFIHYARKSAAETTVSDTAAQSQKGNGGFKMVITSSMMGLYPMPSNPQCAASKHALIGLTRSLGASLLKEENITLNAILPVCVPTGLAPPGLLDFMKEQGHITPMSTIMRAYDTFLEDRSMTGQTVEASLDQLFFRQPVEYPNESQRWMLEDAGTFWEEVYDKKRSAGTA